MTTYYHEIETDTIVSVDTIRQEYDRFIAEGVEYWDLSQPFEHYLECCMYYNNGSLIPVEYELKRVKNRVNRIYATCRHSKAEPIEYYDDELVNLLADMDRFKFPEKFAE